MAYAFVAGSSQYLSTTSAPASGTPMTMAMWSRTSTVSQSSRMFAVSASSGHRNQIGRFNAQIQAVSVGGSAQSAIADNQITTNTWFHVAGTFASSTDRRVFFNGSQVGTSTASPGTQDAFDRINIGAGGIPVGNYHTGDIAEVGVWNVALTAAEIASLADGITCDHVRPDNLVFYAPLIRGLIDKIGGLAITNNGTATVANHPRVYA